MNKLFVSLTASLLLCTVAQANEATLTSDMSQSDKGLKIEESAEHHGWFHSDPGHLPGVSVEGVTKQATSFRSLTEVAKKVQWMGLTSLAGVDNDGVVVFTMNNIPNWVPTFHHDLGNFAFKQVADQEVYYGEWVGHGKDPSKDRVVYYAGNDQTETMPTKGTAIYSVTGINNNNALNKGVLKGEFTADFAGHTLTGQISRPDLTISINGKFTGPTIAGSATANGQPDGRVKGSFFGQGASALAGYAQFTGYNQYDTAFGGTKK